MNVLVVLLLCSIQYIPLEGLQLAPYLPSLAASSERAVFLQAAAAQGDAALIGFIHKTDPVAWASGDAWRLWQGTTALHAAAESRDALAVRALIALGANASVVDRQYRSPLHITARSDEALGATLELLDAGAKVDAVAEKGVTPLMEAVRYNAPNTVNVLLRAGADRTKAVNGGHSVVVQALQKRYLNDPYIADRILGARRVPEPSSYHCTGDPYIRSVYLGSAGRNSADSLFRVLLHNSCDLNSRPMVNARDLFRRTPLHTAVMRNDVDCVRILLDFGADTEAVDWLNRTPLQIAKLCKFGRIEEYLNSQA